MLIADTGPLVAMLNAKDKHHEARGKLIVEATTAQDFVQMAELVRQYADFPLGTVDSSVIAVAERLGHAVLADPANQQLPAARVTCRTALEVRRGQEPASRRRPG